MNSDPTSPAEWLIWLALSEVAVMDKLKSQYAPRLPDA
jgi:hypothetical protein